MIERINLIPEELRAAEKGHFYLLATISIVLYLAILFFLHSGQNAKVDGVTSIELSLKKQADGLKVQAETLRVINNNIADIEGRKNELQAKFELIGSLGRDRVSWSDTLYELSNLVPSGVWLTGLSSSRATGKGDGTYHLSLSGMSLSTDRIADFVEDLNSSPYFKKAAMKFASKSEYNGNNVFSFEAALVLEAAK